MCFIRKLSLIFSATFHIQDRCSTFKNIKMTKRDFFIVLIKIFGLYSIISALFSALPSNIVFVIQNIDFVGVLWIGLVVIFVIGLFLLLLYKADKISDLLKLKNGFDEERIDFGGLKSIDILKFSILIIGGILLINNISSFLSITLFAFKSSLPQGFDQAYDQGVWKYNSIEDYVNWAICTSNLIVGYLLISNFKRLALYLNKKIIE